MHCNKQLYECTSENTFYLVFRIVSHIGHNQMPNMHRAVLHSFDYRNALWYLEAQCSAQTVVENYLPRICWGISQTSQTLITANVSYFTVVGYRWLPGLVPSSRTSQGQDAERSHL